jgi:hypothetical protein
MMTQICNTNYSGGRDGKDHGLRPSVANRETPSPLIAGCGGMCLPSQLLRKHKIGESRSRLAQE